VTFALLTEMFIMAGIIENNNQADKMIMQTIESGKALRRFAKFVKSQNGNPDIVNDYSILGKAKYSLPIIAETEGYVKDINSREIGWAMIDVGAGRRRISDKIDYTAGLKLYKKVGDYVQKDEALGEIFYNNEKGEMVAERIKKSYLLCTERVQEKSKILGKY